jgi:hypothetical protein
MRLQEAIRFTIHQTVRFVSPPAVAAEWVLVALTALLVALAPKRSGIWLTPVRRAFQRVARARAVAILVCAMLPVVVRLTLLPVAPVPQPSIHDEFSHLLLADTFAEGRLTNPTHPMWRHFESIHIIQRPTYNSMYPPGQAAFLALGQVIFGHPWAGVLISVALMSAAVCWMMQGWLPPVWALFGTLVLILKIGIVGFWMNSYMGGAVAAVGGALLMGSLPRLRRNYNRPLHWGLLGMGLVVLMNTRPFEGAVLGAAAVLWLGSSVIWRVGFHRSILRAAIPAVLLIACGLLFTLYYSAKVTGSPTKLPYQVNRDTYGWPENLAFLPPKQVTTPNRVLRSMYTKEVRRREIYSRVDFLLADLVTRVFDNWTFLLGPLLTAPLIGLPALVRSRSRKPLLVFVVLILLLNLFQLVLYPYHLAPVVSVIFAIVAFGVRYVYVNLSRFGKSHALVFVVALPLALTLIAGMKLSAEHLHVPLAYWERAYEPHRDPRVYIERWLHSRPRKQLVLVRYSLNHSPDQEWVYNRASIDAAKVVWAREMDSESNRRLLAYFNDREAWLLEADVHPSRVIRYPVDRPVPVSGPCALPADGWLQTCPPPSPDP